MVVMVVALEGVMEEVTVAVLEVDRVVVADMEMEVALGQARVSVLVEVTGVVLVMAEVHMEEALVAEARFKEVVVVLGHSE